MLYILTSVWLLHTPNAGEKVIFSIFCAKKLLFLRFPSFLAQKALKMTISTSISGAQHPNAGRNIQQSNSKKELMYNNKDKKES